MTESQSLAKKTLMGWKSAVTVFVSIFVAGVVATVVATSYIDRTTASKYYEKTAGVVLEEKVRVMEDRSIRQEAKMDTVKDQQTQILMKLGEVNGKLDRIK